MWSDNIYNLLKVKSAATPREVYRPITQMEPNPFNIKRTKMIKKNLVQGLRKDKIRASMGKDSESEFDPHDF